MVETDGDDRGGRAAGTNHGADEGADDGADEGTLRELRALLNGPEQRRLEALEEKLRRFKLRPQDVSQVLHEAILMHSPEDGRLAQALDRHVGKAMESAVRRNPAPIRDALVPVFGPIIRKYVRSTLTSMLENLNRALEYSFTLKGLRWRWEAFRTGRPFAEVVLLHSLEYRVEEIYLIHRDSGLLLQHAAHASVAIRDPDMVSGMLTAIRDFVQDSFDAPEGSEVSSVQVGDFRLVVNADERLVLAAVVRGLPPEGLSRRLGRALERLSSERAADLAEFTGDDTAFRATRPLLEEHLELEFVQRNQPVPVAPALLAIVALIALAWLAHSSSVRYFQRAEWRRAFAQLEAEPGIALTSQMRRDGRWIVSGLRDPDARRPEEVLANLTIDPGRARFVLDPYLSLEDVIIERRASRRLAPPQGVRLEVVDGVLRAIGRAPADWIAELRSEGPRMPGVVALDLGDLADER